MPAALPPSLSLVTWPLLAAALIGLIVAVNLPLGTTVYGLILFGIFHNLFELRYVASRFVVGKINAKTAWIVSSPILTVIGVRLLAGDVISVELARRTEVVLLYGALMFATLLVVERGVRRSVVLSAIGAAGALSTWWYSVHFLMLTHLHNLIPIVFLMLHRSEKPTRLVVTCLFWGVFIPAALLSGALDGIIVFEATQSVGPIDMSAGARMKTMWAPDWANPILDARIVTTFSFLQWMHYFIWIFYLPRFTVFASPKQGGVLCSVLFGWSGLLLAATLTVAMVPLYLSDYLTTLSVYGALASFHALIEFPILLFFVLTTTSNSTVNAPKQQSGFRTD